MVESVVLPEETHLQRSLAANPSLTAQPQTRMEVVEQPRMQAARPSVVSEPTPSYEQEIASIAQQLQQRSPDQVELFIQSVRDAATSDRLPQVISAWKATLRFMPAVTSMSGGREEREPLKIPQPQKVWGAAAQDSTPELPIRTQIEPQRLHQPEHSVSAKPIMPEVEKMSHERQLRSVTGADGRRRLQYERFDEADPVPVANPQDSLSLPTARTTLEMNRQLALIADSIGQMPYNSEDEKLKLQVQNRLLYAMLGDGNQAMQPFNGLDPNDTDYWRHLLRAQSQFFDDSTQAPLEAKATDMVESLQRATAALKPRADLLISPPLLCTTVRSFGNYEEVQETRFSPGQPVVVYWEVQNFESVPTRKGYRTSMSASFEIYDTQGKQQHTSNHPFTDDYCQRKRNDYFNAVIFNIPKKLKSGDYTLRVTLRDKTTDKVAENQCKFTIK